MTEMYREPETRDQLLRKIDYMTNVPKIDGSYAFTDRETEVYVNNIMTSMGFGNMNQRITNNLRGVNILQNQQIPYTVSENMGYVFFTRPSLNLSYDNIAPVRKMTPLLTTDQHNVWRYVRATLDHIGASHARTNAYSPYVDPLNPFIPVLTNCIETLGGWPNPSVEVYSSKAGNYKDQWAMVDSSYHIYGNYNLSASFVNPPNDVISKMFNTWTMYSSYVYEGEIAAYKEARVQRYIDYQTRIYRFVMDYSKTKILKWANTGVAFPTTNTDADSMDFDRKSNFNENAARMDQSFTCTGAEYNDPITLHEFNMTVMLMNPNMQPNRRKKYMVKLEQGEKMYFNYLAYPFINLSNNELEWYCHKSVYQYFKMQLGGLFHDNPIQQLISASKR